MSGRSREQAREQTRAAPPPGGPGLMFLSRRSASAQGAGDAQWSEAGRFARTFFAPSPQDTPPAKYPPASLADPTGPCATLQAELQSRALSLHGPGWRTGRTEAAWCRQWRLLHGPLTAGCDPDTLRDVLSKGPRIYDRFLARNLQPRPGLLPVPLEFLAVTRGVGMATAPLPSAQTCLTALQDDYDIRLPRLTPGQICSDLPVSDAAGGFGANTPLCFYVQKEAALLSGGHGLGPLGSRIVADTIIGLIAHDPDSYWNAAPGGQSWTPARAFQGGTSLARGLYFPALRRRPAFPHLSR